jgi:hypothetical protein
LQSKINTEAPEPPANADAAFSCLC